MTDACGPLFGLRVLVVEDEMMISLLIEDTLTDENCIVIGPFERVSVATEAVQTEAFDFALLDVNVAGVKAFPLADIIAARGIPFLFLSGYGQAAIPADHPEWRVCPKPFRSNQLVAMILEQMGERR